jgi:hypothetical protein
MLRPCLSSESICVWQSCYACGVRPIVGKSATCITCSAGPENTLCEACYILLARGLVVHPIAGVTTNRGAVPHIFRTSFGQPRSHYSPWLAVQHVGATAPPVPECCVVRPEFCCGVESFFGAYAFVVEFDRLSSPVLLTALHVMDELLRTKGLDCSSNNFFYTGQEAPGVVTGVRLYDLNAPNWVFAEIGFADSMLTLPDARLGCEEPYSQRDIAAFRVSDASSVMPISLAGVPPPVGEAMWLVVSTSQGGKIRLIETTVVELTDQTLVFRFVDAASLPRFTSGAPLLNSAGDVVGINTGCGFLEGHFFGHGNHIRSIRRHLHTACDLQIS